MTRRTNTPHLACVTCDQQSHVYTYKSWEHPQAAVGWLRRFHCSGLETIPNHNRPMRAHWTKFTRKMKNDNGSSKLVQTGDNGLDSQRAFDTGRVESVAKGHITHNTFVSILNSSFFFNFLVPVFLFFFPTITYQAGGTRTLYPFPPLTSPQLSLTRLHLQNHSESGSLLKSACSPSDRYRCNISPPRRWPSWPASRVQSSIDLPSDTAPPLPNTASFGSQGHVVHAPSSRQ